MRGVYMVASESGKKDRTSMFEVRENILKRIHGSVSLMIIF